MAKGKKAKKSTHRRRRIGAAKLNPNSMVVKLISAIVGFFFADKFNPLLDKLIPATVDQKIVGIAQAGVGTLLIMSKAKQSRGALPWIKSVGGGVLLGTGAKRALKAFGVISGYQRVPVVGGYGAVPVVGVANRRHLNGYSPNQALNGYNVPRPMNVMGSMGSGSGVTNTTGGDLMATG